jgi:cytosine deaminase
VNLVVRNARLLDGRLVDLGAEGGRWVRIGEVAVDGAAELDAGGRLATPPLVDYHLHLDASLTAGRPRWNASRTLLEGVEVWGELKPSLTERDVFDRAHEIVRWSAAQGTLYIRAHADVSGENEAMLRRLLRLRDEVADLCTIQVTAFAQDGIFAIPARAADLVVFEAPSAVEVLRLHPPRRWVIRRGRVVAGTTPARTTLLGERAVTFAPPPPPPAAA